ncbi:hypothetical protein [Nannocystis pusilla]|uniref:hypothetical protein n=1 Tax=Nannocystis pusilla TaxID=889268 RepID=UPI003B81196E
MSLFASTRRHGPTATPPLKIGVSPGKARQTTSWPPLPESAAAWTHGVFSE